MRGGLTLLMAVPVAAAASACTPVPLNGEAERSAQPDRHAILRQAVQCGLRQENLEFTVDEEGVDNADIFPIAARDRRFDNAVNCMIEWGAQTGAALGFEFEPRSR